MRELALSLLAPATLMIWVYYRGGLARFARLAFLLPPMILPVAITLAGLGILQHRRSPAAPFVCRTSSTRPSFRAFQFSSSKSHSGKTIEFGNPEFSQFDLEGTEAYEKQRGNGDSHDVRLFGFASRKGVLSSAGAAFLKDFAQSEGCWESCRGACLWSSCSFPCSSSPASPFPA